jgi:predicted histidine transporter YuiF (NhaC family)
MDYTMIHGTVIVGLLAAVVYLYGKVRNLENRVHHLYKANKIAAEALQSTTNILEFLITKAANDKTN